MSNYIKWTHVKEKIEADIVRGNYKAYTSIETGQGVKVPLPESLPSIAQIAEIYGCGKSTAQKVLNEMCNSGILIRKKGVGYFIEPFVREKLKNKQRQDVQQNLIHIIYTAKELDIRMEDLNDMYKECLDSIYSQ